MINRVSRYEGTAGKGRNAKVAEPLKPTMVQGDPPPVRRCERTDHKPASTYRQNRCGNSYEASAVPCLPGYTARGSIHLSWELLVRLSEPLFHFVLHHYQNPHITH